MFSRPQKSGVQLSSLEVTEKGFNYAPVSIYIYISFLPSLYTAQQEGTHKDIAESALSQKLEEGLAASLAVGPKSPDMFSFPIQGFQSKKVRTCNQRQIWKREGVQATEQTWHAQSEAHATKLLTRQKKRLCIRSHDFFCLIPIRLVELRLDIVIKGSCLTPSPWCSTPTTSPCAWQRRCGEESSSAYVQCYWTMAMPLFLKKHARLFPRKWRLPSLSQGLNSDFLSQKIETTLQKRWCCGTSVDLKVQVPQNSQAAEPLLTASHLQMLSPIFTLRKHKDRLE